MSAADQEAVDRELGRLLAEAGGRPGPLPLGDHERLWDAVTRASEGGGRSRPRLLTTTHRVLGGTRPQAAVEVGAAIELLHTAFVVQDDVIDGDQVRRGRASLPGGLARQARRRGATAPDARRYGDAGGILAGDLALLTAFRAISRCQAPAPLVSRLLDLLDSTVHASAAGELADVRLQLGLVDDPSPLREALAIAELKTAVYSFQLPLHAGALLADAPPAVLTALDEVGALLGVGFQLFDDLLGVFGDESRTGKSALGDLREGKRTALLAHASTTEQWHALQPLIGTPDLDEAQARRVRALLSASGSRAWTEELARWHLSSAGEAAIRHRLPGELSRALSEATAQILETAERSLLPEMPASCAAPMLTIAGPGTSAEADSR